MPEKAPTPEPSIPPQSKFAYVITAAGLNLAGQTPIMDGVAHRVPLQNTQPGNLDGAYLGFMEGVPAGFVLNHKTGEKITWKATGHVLSKEQKSELKAEAIQRQAAHCIDPSVNLKAKGRNAGRELSLEK